MEKFEKMLWEIGNPLPAHLENNMDEKDKKYLDEYSKVVKKYSETYSSRIELDVTKDYTPPKDLYVEVRVREDVEIKTKTGGSI